MKNILKSIAFILVFLSTFIFYNSTSASANNRPDLINNLNNYAQQNENADFERAELKGNNLVIYIADDYVEPVNDFGLESYLHDTYNQINKFQKKNHTKFSIEFNDKESGKIAKSSYSGKGWFKSNDSSNTKYDFNYKTGDVD